MKAIVKQEPRVGASFFPDWRDPAASPGEIVVAVHRAGLCGTDLSMYDWNHTIEAGYQTFLPVVMGHEMCGEVVDIGAGVDTGRINVGDQVALNPALTCGECRFCRAERSMLCPSRRVMGIEADGGFAQYISLPLGNALKFEQPLPWELAAVAEPFAVALHSVERVPIEQGDLVVIVGAGSIGFCLIAALKLSPFSKLVMVGLESDSRQLALARELGVQAVTTDEAEEMIEALSAGQGADVVFEAAGDPRAAEQAVRLTRRGGHVGLVGLPHEAMRLDAALLSIGEKELIGIRAYDYATWRRVPRVIERARTELEALVTHQFPLEEFDSAVEATRKRHGLKVLVDPRLRPEATEDGDKMGEAHR